MKPIDEIVVETFWTATLIMAMKRWEINYFPVLFECKQKWKNKQKHTEDLK